MNLHRISKDIFSDHDETSRDFWSQDGNVYLDFRNFTAREQGSHFRDETLYPITQFETAGHIYCAALEASLTAPKPLAQSRRTENRT